MAKGRKGGLATMGPAKQPAEKPPEQAPEAAAPEQPTAPRPQPPAGPANWKFNLRSKWTIPSVVITGAASEEEARKELHRLLDLAIQQVERTR